MANAFNPMKSNPNALSAWMAGQKYNANVALPNEHDEKADFFGQVKQQFTKNGKPRGVDAVIAGVGAGLEHAYKLKGIGMRKEQLQKYNEVMDYFMEVNNEAEKQRRALETQEAQRQKLMPYASASMELAYSGQPYDVVNERIRNLFEQVQTNDPSVKGKYMGFVPNSPMVLIRDENGKNSVISLANIVGEEGTQRIQKGWIDQQKTAIDQQRADATSYKDYAAGNKYTMEAEYMPRTVDLREREARTAEKNAATRFEALGLKNVKELVPRLQSATITAKLADDVLKDAQKHPDIFNSVLSGWINTKGDAGAFSLWAQKLAVSPKERDAYMRVAKNLNNLMLSEVKGIGGTNNMTIDSWIKEGTPNMQYSVPNIEYMIGQAKIKAEFYRDLYRDTLNNTGASTIGSSYDKRVHELEARSELLRDKLDNPQTPAPAAAPPAPQQQAAPQQQMQPMAEGGQYTKMISPEGNLVAIPTNRALEAEKAGYKFSQ